MKVVLFNGSPRREGNTYHSLHIILDELKAEGINCEYIWIGNEKLQGCTACGACKENKDKKCILQGDNMNSYYEEVPRSIYGNPYRRSFIVLSFPDFNQLSC